MSAAFRYTAKHRKSMGELPSMGHNIRQLHEQLLSTNTLATSALCYTVTADFRRYKEKFLYVHSTLKFTGTFFH